MRMSDFLTSNLEATIVLDMRDLDPTEIDFLQKHGSLEQFPGQWFLFSTTGARLAEILNHPFFRAAWRRWS